MLIRITKVILGCAVWVFDYLRNVLFFLLRKKQSPSCVILYYHVVKSEQRAKFARQMDYLVRFATPISLDQIACLPNGGHCAAITFDDGFASAIENALPELEPREIPATMFIPTAYIGDRPGWEDLDPDSRNEVVMNVDQIRRAERNPLLTISSHCRTHAKLSSLGEEDARNEIVESKKDLETILGAKVSTLSFPHGDYAPVHAEWAREAGYERLFSISPELLNPDNITYVTGRIRVDPTDWPLEFRLKLLGAYRWLPAAFAIKSKFRVKQ